MEYVIIGLLAVAIAAFFMRDKISEKVSGFRSSRGSETPRRRK